MTKVKVEQGWLEGEELKTCVGNLKYISFKGIPYATPPLGKLRFKAPLPPSPWTGVRAATQHGPNCTQMDIFTKKAIPGSEDCLHLNVYTPTLQPTKPLAVMVFIHGGGYQSGSGDVQHYGPDFLVQHDVVLVTINYRLGPLGFLCLDTKDVPGNAGLKDQVAALKWVKKNIAVFGGDPENVTVFGESAGGASTAFHILSPMSKGLFKRAAPMSGVMSSDWSIAFEPVKRAFQLGKQLGFTTNDPDKLLDFLQSVPVEKINITTNPCILASELKINNLAKFYHYTPVIEKNLGQEQFIGESPFEILRKGAVNKVDVLMGHTSCEALIAIPEVENSYLKDYNTYHELFVPRKILYEKSPSYCFKLADKIIKYYFNSENLEESSIPQFIKYINEEAFIYPIRNFIDKLATVRPGKLYFYNFSSYSKRNIYGQLGEKFGLKGASHLDDLVYLFDPKHAKLELNESSTELELVHLACSLFTNFAKYGNPTPDLKHGVTWPEYDSDSKACGDIGHKLTVNYKVDQEACDFWQSIFADADVEALQLFH